MPIVLSWLIWTLPPGIAWLITGAEITWPSRTIARSP
jgi:hypothetical protein